MEEKRSNLLPGVRTAPIIYESQHSVKIKTENVLPISKISNHTSKKYPVSPIYQKPKSKNRG